MGDGSLGVCVWGGGGYSVLRTVLPKGTGNIVTVAEAGGLSGWEGGGVSPGNGMKSLNCNKAHIPPEIVLALAAHRK